MDALWHVLVLLRGSERSDWSAPVNFVLKTKISEGFQRSKKKRQINWEKSLLEKIDSLCLNMGAEVLGARLENELINLNISLIKSPRIARENMQISREINQKTKQMARKLSRRCAFQQNSMKIAFRGPKKSKRKCQRFQDLGSESESSHLQR